MDERLHAEEQASLTNEEKASLFIQLLDARKKHFAALRAQEIRNKPPTKMQKRTTMCNYLKNMAGYKHNQLRHKSFDDIQKLFDKALQRVNTFVPMDTEKVEGCKAKAAGSKTKVEESSKRAGEELDRESIKKQKVEDETEQAELKECFEINPFDEDAVNTIPLATKQAPIVDYKITRDARKIYYHITRAYGSTKVYMRFEAMLKMFDREDLEVLYRIVKDRFKSTKPVGDNRVLWGNLMTMFEPSAGDEMWREQGKYLIKSWKLIDSCGEGKLQVDYECEMAFELLSEYHKSMETIGIPPDKHETDENEEGKPLSAGKSSEVSTELFQKAHLYVIQNTDEIVPYIDSLDNNNSDSYSTSQINTSEEIDYDSSEPPKSLLKWYHYLSDEYKDNGRFWGSKSGSSEASSKAKVEACGSKVKVEACGLKAKLQASTKTLIIKSPVPITNCILRLANAKTWDAIKGKTFVVQIPPIISFAEVKIGKRNLRKIIEISSDSSEDRKGASKATAPIFYGPSTQGFLDAYGYNTIEEYLSWNYFPNTDNESTDMETTDKRNTNKDCIVDSNSAMSKDYQMLLHRMKLKRKWEPGNQKLMQIRQRGKERCHVEADHALAFDQSFLGSLTCLHIAYAHCICTLHLQLAFASKHLHMAIADCICTLHLYIAFVHCICSLHLQASIYTLHLHIAFAG
ncbi:hypothetical protein Tco_0593112 [Tanacetum coccineum]